MYDFDTYIERRGTSCLKFDFGPERRGRDDLLPLWVADMDFRLPDEILEALENRVHHGIFGYTDPKETYGKTVQAWFRRRYGWEIDPEWNVVTPGVVFAIATAIRAFTKPSEAVLIQQPVYYPFGDLIERNGRRLINNQLVLRGDRYIVDLEDFERKIQEEQVKLFILCNPHNPVGRVWTREELEAMGQICLRHQVLVFSDEIHCDFVYPGHSYTPYASLGEEYAACAVIGTAPSKTFNLAGLQISNILIPDRSLRRQFREELAAAGYSQCNAMGLTAATAVFEKGDAWLEELLVYLRGNLDRTREYLQRYLPEIRLIEPEGTYLIWLDMQQAAENKRDLRRLVEDEAKLWIDAGSIFGCATDMFIRINIACPWTTLQQALDQLRQAVEARKAAVSR